MPDADQSPPLERTVAELSLELDGMRASARLRAVIEQAKGVLMAREGITADEAFGYLRRLSQQHNVRLLEVATSVVAMAAPRREDTEPAATLLVADVMPLSREASGPWRELRAEIERDVAATLLDTVASSTRKGDQAAQLLADVLAPDPVRIISLYRLAPGGALHLVGQVGVPGDVAAAWAVIPPTPELPLSHAVSEGRALFWATRAERERRFPAVAGVQASYEATAAIPIREEPDGGPIIGVVGLAWSTPRTFTDDDRERITATVGRVGRLMLPNLGDHVTELAWLAHLQSLHLDPWLILEVSQAVTEPSALVFRVRDTSQDLPGATDWLGKRLLELWPDLANDGTWNSLAALARDGGVWATTVTAPTSAPWGTPGSRLRALRLGRHLVLVWRPWLARRTAGQDAAPSSTSRHRASSTAGGPTLN